TTPRDRGAADRVALGRTGGQRPSRRAGHALLDCARRDRLRRERRWTDRRRRRPRRARGPRGRARTDRRGSSRVLPDGRGRHVPARWSAPLRRMVRMARGSGRGRAVRILLAFAAIAVAPMLAGRPVRHVAGRAVAWAFGCLLLSVAFVILHAARVPQA